MAIHKPIEAGLTTESFSPRLYNLSDQTAHYVVVSLGEHAEAAPRAHVARSLPAQTENVRDEERESRETPLRYLY